MMRIGRLGRVVAAVGMAAATALPLVGSTWADDGGAMPDSHPILVAQLGLSTNWAGWASYAGLAGLAQGGAVSYVRGEWVVPAVACGVQDADSSVWVGIDGMFNNTVEQVGTQQSCVGGVAKYNSWWETYPSPKKNAGLAVQPGDQVRAEVTYVGGDRFVLSLKNLTSGKSFSTTQTTSGAARSSAEWVVEAPYNGGVVPLANFGKVNISNGYATINGQTRAIASTGLLSILNTQGQTMIDLKSLAKATATNPALNAGGDDFQVSWVRS